VTGVMGRPAHCFVASFLRNELDQVGTYSTVSLARATWPSGVAPGCSRRRSSALAPSRRCGLLPRPSALPAVGARSLRFRVGARPASMPARCRRRSPGSTADRIRPGTLRSTSIASSTGRRQMRRAALRPAPDQMPSRGSGWPRQETRRECRSSARARRVVSRGRTAPWRRAFPAAAPASHGLEPGDLRRISASLNRRLAMVTPPFPEQHGAVRLDQTNCTDDVGHSHSAYCPDADASPLGGQIDHDQAARLVDMHMRRSMLPWRQQDANLEAALHQHRRHADNNHLLG